jgi:hypothetical protein
MNNTPKHLKVRPPAAWSARVRAVCWVGLQAWERSRFPASDRSSLQGRSWPPWRGSIGGAAGGIIGALVGMGIPEFEAKRYEGKIREGNILISVHTEDAKQRARAKDVFELAGAEDISYTSEASLPKAAAADSR